MKLTILGSGTSVPHPQRASPAFWLATTSGTILLDISADAPHRMAQESLDWPHLDAIWISHFHLDHIGGLAPFLFGMKWAPQTENRTRPLRIFGPEGLRRLIETINSANNYRLFEQRFAIEFIEVTPDSDFEIMPGITAHTLKTPHTNESLALRLKDADSKPFVYTSDTGFSEDLAPFAKDAALLLMECSFRRNKPIVTHLELVDALRIANASSPKRMVLTHLYPEWDDVNVATEAKTGWQGETIEAIDGLRLNI